MSPHDARSAASGDLGPAVQLLLFGDSVAKGLGVQGARYAGIVAERLGLELVDFSGSAMMIDQSLDAFSQRPVPGGLAIIAHGITEAIVRPTPRALALMPARWRNPGWMDPRPYYSRSWWKRVPQRLESAARWRIKNLLIRILGGTQWRSPDAYRSALHDLLERLITSGTAVVVLGSPDLDERYFPGSPQQLHRYDDINAALAEQLGAMHIRLSDRLDAWDDYLADHFHPSVSGHARIAGEILRRLEAR